MASPATIEIPSGRMVHLMRPAFQPEYSDADMAQLEKSGLGDRILELLAENGRAIGQVAATQQGVLDQIRQIVSRQDKAEDSIRVMERRDAARDVSCPVADRIEYRLGELLKNLVLRLDSLEGTRSQKMAAIAEAAGPDHGNTGTCQRIHHSRQ